MAGFRVGELSCPTRYFDEASSISFRRSVTYGLGVLRTSADYWMHAHGVSRCPYIDFDPAAVLGGRRGSTARPQP